jgi:hypothetical protein
MRLSVTTVEAFRLWRDTGDWMDLRDLEATIKRETVPNEKMLRGIAFHSVLESPSACREPSLEGHQYRVGARDGSGDFIFSGEGMDKALGFWPDGAREVKTTFDVDGITVVCVADALHGVLVGEGKCTEKIDVENYFDSFQWRAALKAFNATVCRYVLAQGKDCGGRFIVTDDSVPLPEARHRRSPSDP